jgi:CRISPR/Cas system-associated exonuclease Cas4 (RecB family)
LDAQPEIITPEGCDFSVRLWRTDQIAKNSFDSAITNEEDSAVLLAQPGRAGQYDSTASVTALVRFRECPRRYFLGNYLGWQTAKPLSVDFEEEPEREAPDEMGGAELGQAVHDWLAGVREGTPDPNVVELASRFESSELGKRAARADRSGRETALIFALDELVLRGQIDLWFEEGGELIIVDYKTDRFQEQTRAQKLENYGMQLRFYAAALSRQLGRKVDKICLYLLREDHAEFIDVGSEDLLSALIQDFRSSQELLEFPMREGDHCRKCSFYDGLCEVGSESRLGAVG